MNKSLIVGCICAILFAFVAFGVTKGMFSGIDEAICKLVLNIRSGYLNRLFGKITFLGDEMVLIGILVLTLLFKETRAKGIQASAILIISFLIYITVNFAIKRARPEIALYNVGRYSFPSGHSMNSFSLYGTIFLMIGYYIKNKYLKSAIKIALIVVVMGIGLSRIYLGVHYITDVLGGFLASASILAFWTYFSDKLRISKEIKYLITPE